MSSLQDPETQRALAQQHYNHGKLQAQLGNHKRATELFRHSARAGHALSALNLGCYYSNGKHQEPDPPQALKYFQQAANLGEVMAMWNLACIYRDGLGNIKPDHALFRSWCIRSAKGGLSVAQFQAGVYYQNGAYGFPQDIFLAARYYNAAALQNYRQGKGATFITAYRAMHNLLIAHFA